MFPQSRRQFCRGFTLLEIGLALFILLIITAAAMPLTSGLLAEERLKAQAKEFGNCATSARKLAMAEDYPYEVILDKKGFSLIRVPDGGDKRTKALRNVNLSSGTVYRVQHWGENAFSNPAGEAWIFRPDGICEPIRVHFEDKQGWIEYTFNPLTARAQDESYHFP